MAPVNPNDEHNRARAGDMEAAILDAIEVVTNATRMLDGKPARVAGSLSILGDKLLRLMDEIDDAREGR